MVGGVFISRYIIERFSGYFFSFTILNTVHRIKGLLCMKRKKKHLFTTVAPLRLYRPADGAGHGYSCTGKRQGLFASPVKP